MAQDSNLFYQVQGTGKPVLMIPGHGGRIRDWKLQTDFLQKYYQVITFDPRGAGRSSRPGYPLTLEMMTSDISVLLAHLEIKEPVHICAHSMGTLVAQDFALKFPRQVKTLILLAPFAYYPAESLSLPLLRKIYNMDLENKAKTFLNLLFSQNFAQEILHTPEFYQFYKATLEEKENSSLQDLEYQARIMNSDLRDKIKDISCAVLLLAGNEDKLVPLESMSLLKEEIKNSRLNIIPGAGHALQIDSALRINPLIYQFLQENQAE